MLYKLIQSIKKCSCLFNFHRLLNVRLREEGSLVLDIIKFEKYYLNSTTDTQSYFLNTTLG